MRAKFALGQTNGLDELLELVEAQRGKSQLAAYFLHHALIFGRVGGGVLVEIGILVALEIFDDAARNQFHVAL